MRQRFVSVTGFVLAGGASRRMGRPKSQLVLAGETMLERQLGLLRKLARVVAVVGLAEGRRAIEVPVFADVMGGRGPLGGIYTGLLHTRSEFNLFLSCDLPFLDAAFLRYLCERALATEADATVPESPEREINPLCAVYRRRALAAVRATLASGQNKVSRFFPRIDCRIIAWRELARAGISPRVFHNMNTLQDYEEAKRSLGLACRPEG